MKHNMKELTPTELEAVCGRGLLEDILGAIGRFIDMIVSLNDQQSQEVRELYEKIQQEDAAL